jgi:hypothetical protein
MGVFAKVWRGGFGAILAAASMDFFLASAHSAQAQSGANVKVVIEISPTQNDGLIGGSPLKSDNGNGGAVGGNGQGNNGVGNGNGGSGGTQAANSNDKVAGGGGNGQGNNGVGNGNGGSGGTQAGNSDDKVAGGGGNGQGNNGVGNGNGGSGGTQAGNGDDKVAAGGGNGQGNNGVGNGNGVTTIVSGPASVVSQTGQALVNQIQQLEDSSGSNGGAPNAAVQQVFTSGLSAFTVSGVSIMRHDGFGSSGGGVNASSVSASRALASASAAAAGKSAKTSFNAVTAGVTTGVRFDASEHFGFKPGSAVIGLFGNYARSNFDISGAADADFDSYAAGAYVLSRSGPFYTILLFAASWSDGDADFAKTGTISNNGFVTSVSGGYATALGDKLKLDVRGAVNYVSSDGDDYISTAGAAVTGITSDEWTANLSLKLLSHYVYGDTRLRPFVQAGVTESLSHKNQVDLGGVAYNFHQDDTAVFGRVGLDIDTPLINSYVALKGEVADDREIYTGQIGVIFTLD